MKFWAAMVVMVMLMVHRFVCCEREIEMDMDTNTRMVQFIRRSIPCIRERETNF